MIKESDIYFHAPSPTPENSGNAETTGFGAYMEGFPLNTLRR